MYILTVQTLIGAHNRRDMVEVGKCGKIYGGKLTCPRGSERGRTIAGENPEVARAEWVGQARRLIPEKEGGNVAVSSAD